MKVFLDGKFVNIEDDEMIAAGARSRADKRADELTEAQGLDEFKKLYGGLTYAATKFGALCAVLKFNPESPVDIGIIFEMGDLLGALVDIEFAFRASGGHEAPEEGVESRILVS